MILSKGQNYVIVELNNNIVQSTYNNVFCYIDPFADAIKGSEDDVQDGLVHIRIQQRNGRKTLTTVQGLSSEYDLKKIVRACKKVTGLIIYRLPSSNYSLSSIRSPTIYMCIYVRIKIILILVIQKMHHCLNNRAKTA
jgi:hypothetical protein